jgi:hypothetical protein
MINIQKHLEMLGLKVEDKITGFTGVVTSVSFDLYGCIQVVVNPGIDANGDTKESCWFDIARLTVLKKKPVMDRPDFDFGPVAEGKKGPAEKPRMNKW